MNLSRHDSFNDGGDCELSQLKAQVKDLLGNDNML